MALFAESRRRLEATFTGAKNLADAIDKMASVSMAFGFSDPTGTTLTIASAVSLAAKAVSAVASASSELAKAPTATIDHDLRTTLVLYVANEAYFRAIGEILTPWLAKIGLAEFTRFEGGRLEATLEHDDSSALLRGECSAFGAYELQLKAALNRAGVENNALQSLADEVTARARDLFVNLLAKNAEPYATLRNRLINDATASMPRLIADEMERRNVATTTRAESSTASTGLPVQPSDQETVESTFRGLQSIQEQLARIEKQVSSSAYVQTSEAIEVSVQLRTNKTMFDKAKAMLDEGKLVAAASLFETVETALSVLTSEEAINLRARAMANIGHCYHRQGREADAARLFRESHALAPSNFRFRVNMAVANILERNFGDAELLLRQLYKEKPDESDVLELLAETIAQQGSPSEALTLIEPSVRVSEHYVCTLSNLQLKAGRNAEAEATARAALPKYPKSHQVNFTVALAIAAPLLNGEQRDRSISATERGRLREAKQFLETAVAAARGEERQAMLGIYLSNMCAVNSAIGDYNAAVTAGMQAQAINPNDVVLLQNLFAAQIMAERYDEAAATAREIGRLEPGVAPVTREMHALMGANRFDDALGALTAAAAIPGVASDAGLLALRVECLRMRPDVEAAERALSDAYSKLGRVTELLLQEACMRSAASQHETSDRLFQEAVRQADARTRMVARRRYGLYLYSRRRWAEAASCLVEENEDPIGSLVAAEHLHCLFELKRMPQVVEIGTAIIAGGQFRALIWELTAHALAALQRLREAEKLFRELVQHEPTEKHHLSLAVICYRSHGVNAAIKVLEAAQVRHPKSYYVQANLSGLYFTRQDYRKAFDAAKRAVEIAPRRQEGHTAMARILGAGDRLELTDAEKELLQRSLIRSKAVHRIDLKIDGDHVDISELVEILKEQSAHVHRTMAEYREKQLPITILAEILRRPLVDVWFSITQSTTERFYFGIGSHEEQNAERQLASEAQDVIIDATALLTLQSLGLLQTFRRRFPKVHVATATIEHLAAELGTLKSFAASTGTVSYDDGRVRMVEVGPEIHAHKLAVLDEIVAFLESDAVIREGLDEKSWNDWQEWKVPALAAWIVHPMLVAKAKGWALYCDEHGFRGFALKNYGVRGFNSQAALRAFVDSKNLDQASYHKGVVGLVGLNFEFVSITLQDCLWLLVSTKYTRTEVFGKLLRQLQFSGYTDEASAWILGCIVGHLWFELSGTPAERAEWLGLCIGSVNTAKRPELAVIEVLVAAGSYLCYFPETFVALMHSLCEDPRLSSQAREAIVHASFALVDGLAEAFGRVPNPNMRLRWGSMRDWMKLKQKLYLEN